MPGVLVGAPLVAGAVLAMAIGAARAEARAAWLGSCALLTFVALDSAWDLDRQLQGWTGVDWERLYLPVLTAGALAWLLALRSMRSRGAVAAVIAGSLCWLVAEAVWIAAWRGHVAPGEGGGMLDEGLELAGAVLIGLGLAAERIAPRGKEEPALTAR